jgi:hypothetical protein
MNHTQSQPQQRWPGRGATPPPAPANSSDDQPTGRDSPLTPEQMQMIAAAQRRHRKIRGAGRMALINVFLLGSVGAVSLLAALGALLAGSVDPAGLVMGAGLTALAWNEYRGRRLLLGLQPKGPIILGWNQLALLGLVVGYAAIMLAQALSGPNPYDEIIRAEPMAERMVGDIGRLYRQISILLYGSLIAATLVFQGLAAWYYFSRGRLLRDYLHQTPGWIVELQRRQATAG